MRFMTDTIDSLIGPITLVASETGLSHIYHASTLPVDVEQNPNRSEMELYRVWIREFLSGKSPAILPPLDIQHGTDLQRAVWHSLSQIPYGETISYSELARAVDKPEAVRAVASACGANPLPLIIPCHRVIAKDGGLGGFAWGLDAKRYLLDLEHPKPTAQAA